MIIALGTLLALGALGALGCARDPEPAGVVTTPRDPDPAGVAGGPRDADPTGVARGLGALAAERQVALSLHRCAPVDQSRVVICDAELTASELAQLRSALIMGPLGQTKAPGPAFGKSRCLDRAPAGAIALVTGFPWIQRSHYRYLLIVVPAAGGRACVETEEGYG